MTRRRSALAVSRSSASVSACLRLSTSLFGSVLDRVVGLASFRGPVHSSQNFACGRFSCWHRGQCIANVSRFRLAAGHDHASPDPWAAAGTWRPGRPRGATAVPTLPDWRPQAPAGLLRPGSRSVGGSHNPLEVGRGRRRALPPGSDDPGHLLERLGREDGPHLLVAGLVPANAGDRPDLREESRAVTVHGELAPVEPLDAAVTSGDGREALGVLDDPEPQRTREFSELLKPG